LARELGQAGNDVTFFLVQNGVMSARAGAMDAAFDQVVGGKSVFSPMTSLCMNVGSTRRRSNLECYQV
jgi:hypothetical protein